MMFLFLFSLCMTATSWAHRLPRLSHAPESVTSQSLNDCPVPPGQTVPQQMDSDNLGVEKLVIYLYRKVNSQEIVAHIPYGIYQNCIPDFSQLAGVVNNNFGDSIIKNVFNNSEGRTVLYRDKPSKTVNNEKDGSNDDWYWDNEKVPSWQLPLEQEDTENVPVGNDEEDQLLDMPQNPVKFNLDEHPELQYGSVKKLDTFPSESDEYFGNDDYWSEMSIPTILTENPQLESKSQGSSGETEPDFQSYTSSDYRPSQYVGNIQNRPDSYGISPNHFSSKKLNSNSGDTPNQDLYFGVPPYRVLDENQESDSNEKYSDSYEPLISDKHEKYRPNDAKEDHEFKYQQYLNPHIHSVSEKDSIKQLEPHLEPDVNSQNRQIPHKWQKVNIPLTDSKGKVYGFNQKIVKLPAKKQKPEKWSYWESKEKSHRWMQHRVPKSASIHRQNKRVVTFDYWLMNQLNNIKESGAKVPLTSDEINTVKQAIIDALKVNGLRINYDGTLVDAEGNVSSLDNLRLQPIMIVKSLPHDRLYEGVGDEPFESQRMESAPFQSLLVILITPRKILGIIPIRIYPNKGRTWQTNEQKSLYRILPVKKPVLAYRQLSERIPYLENVNITADDEAPGFRIIGGSSAVGTGTPLANRGRSGLEEAEPISLEVTE